MPASCPSARPLAQAGHRSLMEDRYEARPAPAGRDRARGDTGAGGPGPVIAPIGSDADDAVMARAMAIARQEDRALVIVDRGGEGLLGNPYYEDLRSDDDFKPRPDRSFDASIARREGRNDLARYIDVAASDGLSAGGWFPTASGLSGIREAIERFGGSVLVVPSSVEHPSLGERFKGITKDNLDQLGVRVVEA